jgi:hypothetical protein
MVKQKTRDAANTAIHFQTMDIRERAIDRVAFDPGLSMIVMTRKSGGDEGEMGVAMQIYCLADRAT